MTTHQDMSDHHAAVTQAFSVSVAELERLVIPVSGEIKERLAMAILDLSRAGQRDAEALARYAVSRIRAGR